MTSGIDFYRFNLRMSLPREEQHNRHSFLRASYHVSSVEDFKTSVLAAGLSDEGGSATAIVLPL